MRAPIIRGLCAVAVGAAILPLGLASTAGATVSPACRAHHATVYVVNQGSGTVTPIRTATNTAGKPINVGQDPYDIAITPNGRTAYVTHVATFPPGIVTPIHLPTGTAGKPIKFGQGPQVIAITPPSCCYRGAATDRDDDGPLRTPEGAQRPISVAPSTWRSRRTGRSWRSSTSSRTR